MPKDTLDIVITATIRPDILNLTLKSFTKNFLEQFKYKKLIINIDPIGDKNYSANDIIVICKKYFDNIIVNTPNNPSFPKAVKWCWEQVQSQYFLHLEDDWLLKKTIDKNKIYKTLREDTRIMSIRFFLSKNSKNNMNDKQYCYSNGFSLNPSIIKKDFITQLLLRFDTNLDPEKQFNDIVNSNTRKFILYGNQNDGYFTIDTGKKWRRWKKFNKPNISLSSSKSWLKNEIKNFNIRDYLNYKIHMIYWGYLSK